MGPPPLQRRAPARRDLPRRDRVRHRRDRTPRARAAARRGSTPRPAHRRRQPHGAVRGADAHPRRGRAHGRVVRRPRRVQGRQRPVRAHARRRAAVQRRGPRARRDPQRRHARARRRRRVRRHLPRPRVDRGSGRDRPADPRGPRPAVRPGGRIGADRLEHRHRVRSHAGCRRSLGAPIRRSIAPSARAAAASRSRSTTTPRRRALGRQRVRNVRRVGLARRLARSAAMVAPTDEPLDPGVGSRPRSRSSRWRSRCSTTPS